VIDWNTIPLKDRKTKFKEISEGKSLLLKTAMLTNMYEGCDSVLINCGPTAAEFDYETIKEFCKDKVLFTVKVVTQKYEKITDVHISNTYATWHFPKQRPYLVLTRQEMPHGYENWINTDMIELETHSLYFKNEPDIMWGSDITARHSNSVCLANRWEENSFKNNPYNRIIGPGIMNDTIVPLLVHTGVSKVSILGWDGAQMRENGSIEHFYDHEPQYTPTMNYVSPHTNKFNLNNLKSDTDKCERDIGQSGEERLAEYLTENNIELEILTKNSTITDKIKRNYVLYKQ